MKETGIISDEAIERLAKRLLGSSVSWRDKEARHHFIDGGKEVRKLMLKEMVEPLIEKIVYARVSLETMRLAGFQIKDKDALSDLNDAKWLLDQALEQHAERLGQEDK